MALITCAECGKQISSRAAACPSCGDPVETKRQPVISHDVSIRRWGKYILAAIISAYFVTIWVTREDSVRDKPSAERQSSTPQQALKNVNNSKPAIDNRSHLLGELGQITKVLDRYPCANRKNCTGEFDIESVDLNGDKQPEYQVSKNAYCGSGGCDTVLLMKSPRGWEALASIELGYIKIEKEMSRNMKNVSVWQNKEIINGEFTYDVTRFSWDGTAYQTVSARREDQSGKAVQAISSSKQQSPMPDQQATSRSKQKPPPPEEPRIFQLGEALKVGYTAYEVLDAYWTDKLPKRYGSEDRPDASFLIIDLAVENRDNQERTVPPFKLVDESGAEYGTSSKAWLLDKSLGLIVNLNPGVQRQGLIVFDVPRSHSYKLKLSGGFWSGASALVQIPKDIETK
jgi:Domain of unknown function (DUF4352)